MKFNKRDKLCYKKKKCELPDSALGLNDFLHHVSNALKYFFYNR